MSARDSDPSDKGLQPIARLTLRGRDLIARSLRIAIPHVERRAPDGSRSQRRMKLVLRHDLGAGHVDEDAAGPQRRQDLAVHETPGLLRKRARHHEVVGRAADLRQARRVDDLVGHRVRIGQCGHGRVHGRDAHAECGGPPGHGLTDAPVAEDHQRLAVDFAMRNAGAVDIRPGPGREAAPHALEIDLPFQHRAQRELGDGDLVLEHVAQDGFGMQRLEVDAVEAGARHMQHAHARQRRAAAVQAQAHHHVVGGHPAVMDGIVRRLPGQVDDLDRGGDVRGHGRQEIVAMGSRLADKKHPHASPPALVRKNLICLDRKGLMIVSNSSIIFHYRAIPPPLPSRSRRRRGPDCSAPPRGTRSPA